MFSKVRALLTKILSRPTVETFAKEYFTSKHKTNLKSFILTSENKEEKNMNNNFIN